MKKNFVKRIFALGLMFALMLTFGAAAMAAESSVTYKDGNIVVIEPGTYSATDLFENFKGVMPGDVLDQTIKIKNDNNEFDYIKVYLKANPHGDDNMPITEGIDDVAAMNEFLAQLGMTVKNGGDVIFNASPDQADGLADNVYLGTIAKGEAIALDVQLVVPIELDNDFANAIGEVDWTFTFEGFDVDVLTATKIWSGNYLSRPETVEVNLYRGEELFDTRILSDDNQWTYTWVDLDQDYTWDVKETELPGYITTYTREGNQVFITNYKPGKPDEDVSTSDSITVKKVWEGNGKHPATATMTLYRGDKAVDSVVLSDRNNWTYTWNGLYGAGQWKVLETNINGGFVPLYSTKGDVVTVTNTARLAQTGQLNWPIPVLCAVGLALIAFGVYTAKKKGKNARD